jgi:hypothetical protein
MIVLQESASAQNLDFIPRSFTNVDTITENLYYNRLNAIFDVKQDNFYMVTVKSGSNVIFKDKVFCTNQAITDFTINDSQYTEQETTNEFIFL